MNIAALVVLTVAISTGDTSPAYKLAVVDHVDMIEINHFYDEFGRLTFDQIIYWDWSTVDSRYQVVAWRLLKGCRGEPKNTFMIEDGIMVPDNPKWIPNSPKVPTLRPNGKYCSVWYDGEILREVWCMYIRETWTQFDPELIERECLPKELRRGLSKLPIKFPRPVAPRQRSNAGIFGAVRAFIPASTRKRFEL